MDNGRWTSRRDNGAPASAAVCLPLQLSISLCGWCANAYDAAIDVPANQAALYAGSMLFIIGRLALNSTVLGWATLSAE